MAWLCSLPLGVPELDPVTRCGLTGSKQQECAWLQGHSPECVVCDAGHVQPSLAAVTD